MPSQNTFYPPILLASSSKYRAALLRQLGLEFIQASPNINEVRLANETPHAMVSRLSEQKAYALRQQFPDHIIIASDQVAITQGQQILGKPGNHKNAVEQLSGVNGQSVLFLTGLCLMSPNNKQGLQVQTLVDTFRVHFRQLTQTQIENYLLRERPYDCAGSFKSEGLGISLFTKFEGDDPNTLVGLPLIQLCSLLENIDVSILG